MIGPAAMAWYYACKALQAVQNLEPNLARLQNEFFEQKFLAEVDCAVARLQDIKAIAQRSRKDGTTGSPAEGSAGRDYPDESAAVWNFTDIMTPALASRFGAVKRSMQKWSASSVSL